jgi:endoglucanase
MSAKMLFLRLRRLRSLAIAVLLMIVLLAARSGHTNHVRAAGDVIIYADALRAGWQSWSWDTTIDLANPAPVHGGSASIAVTCTAAWGALYLHSNSGLPTFGYTDIRFWVHGGDTGSQSVMFHVNDGEERYYFSVQANTWSQVIVPLSALGSPASLNELMWQDSSAGAQPTFYVDDIRVSLSPTVTQLFLPVVMQQFNAPPKPIPFKGVNLAGAEFGGNLPGIHGTDYIYPTADEVDYFMGKGMTVFRLPFRWERLQHALLAAFDAAELARMDTFVNNATGRGAYVLLDPHNYARYYGSVIGTSPVPASAFANFWFRLASHYHNNRRVIFGLMNEPNNISTELWVSDANAAIQAIRLTGATNLILVPGNGWSGAGGWGDNWYGTPNAVAMLGITDPGNNYAYEVHQYMDSDGSGTNDCVSATTGSERMANFTDWLRLNHRRAFLGEFGGSSSATCLAALDDILNHLQQNSDLYLGWTYWAAGPWWGDYFMSIEPVDGVDRPQMGPLSKHLP